MPSSLRRTIQGISRGNPGFPLSPTILNVVVYAFLQHWVAVATEKEDMVNPGAASTEGFGRDVKRLESYSYAKYGLITSMRATGLQRVFDTLMELFDRVGLRTNVAKTVSMACQIFRVLGVHSSEAYRLWMTGEGQTYRNQLHQRVQFPDCDVDLAAGSLASHIQAQHIVSWGGL